MLKKIFVVEDHAAFRRTLVRYLNSMRGIEVCAEAGDAAHALAGLPATEAHLVLMDMELRGTMNGFDLISEIRKHSPQLACVIISGYCDPGIISRARALGANGYVEKGDVVQLEKTIRAVLKGKSHFPRFPGLR